jgi:hypothetical protein
LIERLVLVPGESEDSGKFAKEVVGEPRQLASRCNKRGVLLGSHLVQVARVLVAELYE